MAGSPAFLPKFDLQTNLILPEKGSEPHLGYFIAESLYPFSVPVLTSFWKIIIGIWKNDREEGLHVPINLGSLDLGVLIGYVK